MTQLVVPAVIAGVGLSALSQVQAGKEAEAEAERNAAIAREEGIESQRAGREQARLTRAEGRRKAARDRAAIAHAGVKSYTGTPLLLQQETLSEVEREADIFAEEGATTRRQLFSEAAFEEERGKRKRRAGVFGAGTTLLTGLGGLGLALRS